MNILYSAQQVVDEALMGIRDFRRDRFTEGAMYFLRGYRDFQLFYASSIKEAWLDVTPLKTIDLPQDFMDFISVCIVVNGEVWTITRSSKITKLSDPTEQTLISDRGEADTIFRNSYKYSSQGANVNGYFTIDLERNRIILKEPFLMSYETATKKEVLLRYVSNGMSDDLKNSFIPASAANMMIAYVEWKLIASDPEKYPANLRNDKFNEYLMEAEKFTNLALPTSEELLDAIYETAGKINF